MLFKKIVTDINEPFDQTIILGIIKYFFKLIKNFCNS